MGRSSMRRCTSRQFRSAALWSMLSDGGRLAIGHLIQAAILQMMSMMCALQMCCVTYVTPSCCKSERLLSLHRKRSEEVWALASTNNSRTSENILQSLAQALHLVNGETLSTCHFKLQCAAMPGRDEQCLHSFLSSGMSAESSRAPCAERYLQKLANKDGAAHDLLTKICHAWQ